MITGNSNTENFDPGLMHQAWVDMLSSLRNMPQFGGVFSNWPSMFAVPSAAQNPVDASLLGLGIRQSMVFFYIAEQFSTLYQGGINSGADAAWRKSSDEVFAKMKESLYGSCAPYGDFTNPLFGNVFAQLPFPFNTVASGGSRAVVDKIRGMIMQWLSLPGVGQNREFTGLLQAWLKDADNYQKYLVSYFHGLNSVGVNGLDKLREKLLSMCAEKKGIKNLRAVYDLWVDCNEEAYEAWVHNEGFPKLYGQLTNSMMLLRKRGNEVTDKILSMAGMPTRRGNNTLRERQHAMRFEIREMKERLLELEGVLARRDAPEEKQSKKRRSAPRRVSSVTRRVGKNSDTAARRR